MPPVLKVNLDPLKKFDAVLDAIRNNGKKLEPAFKASGLIAMESVNRNFIEGGRPEKWKSLAPITIRQRRGNGTPQPLRDSGVMMSSVGVPAAGGVFELKPLTVRVGTNVPQAGAHNEGIGVPKREFMVLQPEDEDNIQKVFAEHMAGGTG